MPEREMIRILIAEDNPHDAELAQREIRKTLPDCAFLLVQTREAFLEALDAFKPDIIISDYVMPHFDGMSALKLAQESVPLVPVIIWTGSLNEDIAVDCMKAGASNYVIKEHIKRLLPAVLRALEEKKFRLERKQAEEEIRRRTEQLASLHVINTAIISNYSLATTLDTLLEHILDRLEADAAAVLLLDQEAQVLVYAAGLGFCRAGIEQARLPMGEGRAGRIALERKSLIIARLPENAEWISGEEFVSYCGVPLVVKDTVKGVLEVYQRKPFEPTAAWLDFLNVLATNAAIAIDSRQLFEDLQDSNIKLIAAYGETLEGWSRAMDFRDKETEGHTRRVADMTLQLARRMGISGAELLYMHWGALLHDMGKIGIPDHILYKPDKLTAEEWVSMKRHPELAYQMLSPITFLKPALDIPYCHHEHWNGKGYPRGLQREAIPLAARIFTVVDVWDALRSERPYRKALADNTVVEHIRSLAGSQFDPDVVQIFLALLEQGG